MNEPSARSERAAAEMFVDLGEMRATTAAHADRLERTEQQQRSQDAHLRQAQVQIAATVRLVESLALSLSKVEQLREEDHKELRAALIAALREAPRANRIGAILGMILAALALAVILALTLTGRGL